MILKAVCEMVLLLFKVMLALVPKLPKIAFLTNVLTFFNNTICKGLQLFCVFIRPTTVIIALEVVIALFVFRYSTKLAMWVASKIPFLNIDK